MTKKILIIDDEPDIRDYLMAALEDNGYLTSTVFDNESIPEAVLKHQPALIILDIMMPQRSGISVYKELRRTPQIEKIPVALLSGAISESDLMQTDFIQILNKESIPPPDLMIEKPVHLPTLLTSIESIFDKKEEPIWWTA